MAKDANVWSQLRGGVPDAVGTQPIGSETKTDQLVARAKELEAGSANNQWTLAYIYTILFRRGDWAVGLNRPTRINFTNFINQAEARDYDAAELFTMIDVYACYSQHGEEVANIIQSQFNGFTKLKAVIPWVTKNNVKDILELCVNYQLPELREECKRLFPLKPLIRNISAVSQSTRRKPKKLSLGEIDNTLSSESAAAITILFTQITKTKKYNNSRIFLDACKLLYQAHPDLHEEILSEWQKQSNINWPF